MFIDSYSHPVPISGLTTAKTFTSDNPLPVLEFERLSLTWNPSPHLTTTEIQQHHQQQPPPPPESIPIPTHIATIMPSDPSPDTHVSNSNMSWTPTCAPSSGTQASCPPTTTSSLQSRLTTRTTLLPLSLLLRPLPPQQLDQSKVTSMLHTLSLSQSQSQSQSHDSSAQTSLPPVDVLYYKSPKTGREFYFAFGGCHRLSAVERAGREMVECKVVRVTRGMLGGYLGGSLGRVLGEEE